MLQSNGQFNGAFILLYFQHRLPFYVSADSTYETPGRLYAQMAEFDRLTNQTIYKDILKRYFAEAESLNPEFLDMLSVRSR